MIFMFNKREWPNATDHQVAAMISPLESRTARPLWFIRLILIMASLGELVFPLQSSCKIRHPLLYSGAKDVTRRPATLVG